MMNHVIRVLMRFLYGLNCVLNICVSIIIIGCISTCLYHTGHRYVWCAFIMLLTYVTIMHFLLSLLEYVLIVFTNKKIYMFPYEKVENQIRIISLESKVLFCTFVAADIVGRVMVGWYAQTFKGDPWWTFIHGRSFLIMLLFFFCKIIQEHSTKRIFNKIQQNDKE